MKLSLGLGLGHARRVAASGDVTAPTLVSAVINAAGMLLTLTYADASGALDAASVPTLTIGSTRLSVLTGAASVVGLTVTRAFDRPVASDETGITVTSSGAPVRDAAGNNAAALVTQAVTNSSTVLAPLAVFAADLHQWFRGDNVTLNGSNVSTWQDLSGKGNDAIQGGATAQPPRTLADATLNNHPTVAGDGANDVLSGAGLTFDLATADVYMCGMFKATSWTASDKPCSGAGTNPPRLTQTGSSPAVVLAATSSSNSSPGATIGTWVFVEAFWSATAGTSYLKLGSAAEVKTGNPGTGARTSSTLFGDVASAFWAGAIADVEYVKRAAGSGGPTAGERAAIKAYHQARYPAGTF